MDTGGFCTLCGFKVDNFEGLTSCPSCSHTGVPCGNENQVTVSVNIQELKVLCMWAENWAHQHKEETPYMPDVIYAIAHRLRQQLPKNIALTMSDEFEQLRKSGYNFKTNHPAEDV